MNDVAPMLDQTKYEHYIVLDETRDGERCGGRRDNWPCFVGGLTRKRDPCRIWACQKRH